MNNDIPINTLDASELLIQFKLIKALGYKSLWDADFRREMKNPLRRLLYYRLLAMEEAQKSSYQVELLKSIANRISYFSDPELFKKVRDLEDQKDLDTMPENMRQTMEDAHLRKMALHPKMSGKDLDKIKAILKN